MLLQPIARFDLTFSLFCLEHRFNHNVARGCRWVSRSGDGPLYLILGVLALWLDEQQGWLFFSTTVLAFAIELPIYWTAKNLFKRRRPAELTPLIPTFITPSDRYSLPSGHSAAAMIMATTVATFYPLLGPWVLMWALCVGASRILLGVHFFSDVVVGLALGAASAQVAIALWGA